MIRTLTTRDGWTEVRISRHARLLQNMICRALPKGLTEDANEKLRVVVDEGPIDTVGTATHAAVSEI